MSIRNIGILAHVDAGKTSLTENLLYLGGVIRQMGSVDEGSSVTDSLAVERERGISVRSAANTLTWNNHQINLIDTPGHTDFFGEVDRVLSVLDAAVVVISAVEGLQSSVYLLFEALKYYELPVIMFINKIDRSGSDYEQIVKELEAELHMSPYVINLPENEASASCSIIPVGEESTEFEANMEKLAELDDNFLSQYLEGESGLPDKQDELVAKYTRTQQLVPIFCGSAKMSLGVEELLNGIVQLLPQTEEDFTGEVSGRLITYGLMCNSASNSLTICS